MENVPFHFGGGATAGELWKMYITEEVPGRDKVTKSFHVCDLRHSPSKRKCAGKKDRSQWFVVKCGETKEEKQGVFEGAFQLDSWTRGSGENSHNALCQAKSECEDKKGNFAFNCEHNSFHDCMK